MTREVNEVCNYLKSKSIRIPTDNEWIVSCVDCFKEQGYNSMRELNELVYQQWLLADLEDIGVQVIPNELIGRDKYILEGKYAVQLNYLINVAVSFHKQLQKIRRPEAINNLEVGFEGPIESQRKEESGPRMLKIEVTDGVITVIAFEDQFIPTLKEPFVPGMKAILVGPLECRKGVIFLKRQNLILLGGEVEALHIPNAAENILARALKVKENPDPYSQQINAPIIIDNNNAAIDEDDCFDIDEEALMMVADKIERSVPRVNSTQSQAKVDRNVNYNSATSVSSAPSSSSSNTSQTYSQASTVPVCSREQNLYHTKTTKNVNSSNHTIFSVPDIASVDFDDDFDLLAAETAASVEQNLSGEARCIDTVASELQTYQMLDSTSAKKDFQEITSLKQKLRESYGEETLPDSTFNNKPESPKFREDGKIVLDYLSDKASSVTKMLLEPEMSDPVISSSQSEESDLFSLEPFPPRRRPATVTTFAKVIKILKKPKLTNNLWSVSALVEAKSMQLEVSFESHVIDKIFTVSAQEIISKREELANNPNMKKEMNEALQESHSKFNKLACNMTFNFKDAISNPIVTDVINR